MKQLLVGRPSVSFLVAEFPYRPYPHVTLREHLRLLTAPASRKTNVPLACVSTVFVHFSGYFTCVFTVGPSSPQCLLKAVTPSSG